MSACVSAYDSGLVCVSKASRFFSGGAAAAGGIPNVFVSGRLNAKHAEVVRVRTGW